MDAHEFDRVTTVTRRATEHQPVERSPLLSMPSALISLQRLAGNESVSALLAQEQEESQASPVREVVGSGGGSPLDPGTRSFLEDRMGADFSDVRVHTGSKADESARSISAQAYTVGTDVVFRSDAYQPDTPAGRHVLAHELAHVVQQKAGPVAGTPAPGGISISDPGDHFEQAAERAANTAMSGAAAAPVQTGGGGGVTAQRAEPDEDMMTQALTAQRQDDELPEDQEKES